HGREQSSQCKADAVHAVEKNSRIDAAFTPTINEWNNGRYLQLNLKAIRPSEPGSP
ncbi:MAG: hypothetical protein HGA78_09740, partial [Nitrospirales bacterium]|nr:hypothetical protein [Nitrospirales bacterium]